MASSVYDAIEFFQFSACATNCNSLLKPVEESFTFIFATHMQFISQNICHVIIWWLKIIDEYPVKMWAKFNKTRLVCSQGPTFPPKITLVVLLRHVSKSEQTLPNKIRKILAFLHKAVANSIRHRL